MSASKRDAADLTRRMADLGAPDPEDWALSEIAEDIPQQARYLVLRNLWPDAIDGWSKDALRRVPAAARLLAQGVSAAQVTAVIRVAAYEAVFTVLSVIDEGCDPAAPPDAPGWALIETDSQGNATGRQVVGLHEDILMLDPSGTGGADLFS